MEGKAEIISRFFYNLNRRIVTLALKINFMLFYAAGHAVFRLGALPFNNRQRDDLNLCMTYS